MAPTKIASSITANTPSSQLDIMGSKQFNKTCDLFAVVVAALDQHRLRVYETGTNSLLKEFKCTTRVTSLGWGFFALAGDAAGDAAAKKRNISVLAVGTEAGSVELYTKSELVKRISLNSQAVTALICTKDTIICGTQDGQVIVIDHTGHKISSWKADDKIDAISVQKNKLVTAGVSLKMWDLKSTKQSKAFVGHASYVSQCIMLQDKDSEAGVAVISSQDRYISIVYDSGKSFVLTSESNVSFIDEGKKGLLALAEDGSLQLWKTPLAQPSETPVAPEKKKKRKSKSRVPDGIVKFVDANGASIPIITARFCGDEIRIARGLVSQPHFEKISFCQADGTVGCSIVKQVDQIKAQFSENSFENKTYTHQAMDESEALITGVQSQPISSMNHKNHVPEQTIQERLDALSILASTQQAPAKKIQKPKADSLQSMLAQAIHSADDDLLEECLRVSDIRVINKTIQKLPPKYIMQFLKALVAKFTVNQQRVSLTKWIKAVLLIHMGYFMSVEGMVEECLVPLYQLLDQRMSMFGKLLKLQGRLDCLDQSIRCRRDEIDQVQQNEELLTEPAFVYDEAAETEDEEMLEETSDSELEANASDLNDME